MTESRELAQHENGARAMAVATGQAVGIPIEQRMAMLREALVNPDVDPAKAVAMAELMFRLEDRDRQAEFNSDKIAAMRAMPAVFKRGKNDHQGTRYAKFEDMHRAIVPVLARFNLMLDFKIGSEGRDITVQPVLRHQNGWIEEGGIMRGPADTGKGRSEIQAVGSASSYLKRYSMKAMLNLIEDGETDDDGVARADYQMNDRQSGLIIDAEAASASGEWEAFWSKLSVRDRAFLSTTGTTARLGQAKALIGSDAPRNDPPAHETKPDPTPNPDDEAKLARRNAEQWTNEYLAKVKACVTADQFRDLQLLKTSLNGMDKLKQLHSDLYDKVTEAQEDQRNAIAADEEMGNG